MADNHIQFRIGSTFQGDGFKKAALAIQQNQRETRSATRGLGELTSTVEGISPAAAKAVSAVKGIGSAFVAGGIVGGAIQLALQGVGLVLEKVVEKTKEAAEASKTYAGILKDQWPEVAKEITDRIEGRVRMTGAALGFSWRLRVRLRGGWG